MTKTPFAEFHLKISNFQLWFLHKNDLRIYAAGPGRYISQFSTSKGLDSTTMSRTHHSLTRESPKIMFTVSLILCLQSL